MRRQPFLLLAPPLLLTLLTLLILLIPGGQPAAGASSTPADDLLQLLLRARGRQGRAQRSGAPAQQLLGAEQRLLSALVAGQEDGERRSIASKVSGI